MFNHPFTAVNFAVFPHRGVLGGGTARRSLAAMAAKTGCHFEMAFVVHAPLPSSYDELVGVPLKVVMGVL